MHWSEFAWIAVGLAAQGFFAARFLVQWLLSERARRSLMPIHFWYFSVLGAVLLLAYAVHQRDPVISVGQVIGLGVYFRNLEYLGHSGPRHRFGGWFLPWLAALVAAGLAGYALGPDSAARPIRLDSFWTTVGFLGQAVFTGRFVLQWLVTERLGRSTTPVGFWYMSIAGSLILLIYAVAVQDLVIVLGQGLGLVIYGRNLVLIRRAAASGRAEN